jgi:hypothetical protein
MLSRKKEAFCCYNQSMLSRKKEAFRCYNQSMLSRKKEVFWLLQPCVRLLHCRQGPEKDCLMEPDLPTSTAFFLSFFLFCSLLFSLIKNHVSENFNGNNWGRKPKIAAKKLKKH